MADNNLPLSSAYFDGIKQDLIDYMRSQDEFKDYDFTGSRLNVLADFMSYNTLYLQQYSNSALFESWMRTAIKRGSVVQHAQDMGYLPSTIKSSAIDVRLEGVHTLLPPVVELPSGTRFVASIPGNIPYDYVNWDTVQMLRNTDNTYTARIKLVQGVIGQYEIKYKDGANIILRDRDLDRDYIRVFVDENEWTNWTDKSMVNTTGGSTVYYLRETMDGNTEIYFGEGEETDYVESGGAYDPKYVGGIKPVSNQTIRIEYLKTSGKEANGAVNVQFADSVLNFEVTKIKENPDDDADYTGSAGGGDAESTSRIRELAPIFRESQRRCVTKLDYETFVSQKFGNYVQAIQCYGDSDRPGYAFIAIKPKDGLSLTTTQKEDIEAYLDEFNIITITAKVVDPDYLYIKHNIKVNYKQGSLPEGTDYLRSQIVNSVSEYYDDEVEIFNKSFHVSRMLTRVDDSHVSVLGSRCDISLVREVINYYQTPMAGVSFMNPIKAGTLTSEPIPFLTGGYDVYMSSDSDGKIWLGPFADEDVSTTAESKEGTYYVIGGISSDTGRMDYDFGVLSLDSDEFGGTSATMYAEPIRDNIYVSDGSLCVYEYDLRPQYTNITLEAIS